MRKIVSTILLLLAGAAAPLVAQNSTQPFPTPIYYASAFNLWSLNLQAPNTYTFQGRALCNSNGQNTPFFVFNTNAPVFIADSNSANSEVATPSAVVNTAGSCGVSISPSNQHFSAQLRSGTAGLQEAINTVSSGGGYPALIQLDRNFFVAGNNIPGKTGLTIITSAAGGVGALLQDITSVPFINWVWNGTTYTKTTWVNDKPVAAAGAGAGTGPTIADVGTALSGTVTLTTGTSTTTGTLFTLTSAANTVTYSPTCTIKSTGANAYTTFTVAGSGAGVCTVTVATTPPVASTVYSFSYQIK